MNEQINIINYFRPIKNKWWVILSIFVVAEITSVIITVRQPKTYESTATILLPKTERTPILKQKASTGLTPTQSIYSYI